MKTVELATQAASVADLLSMARKESVLVTTEDGESFLISSADDFESEVQLLRRNHEFLATLDRLKRDRDTIPLEEAEKALRKTT
ncbi:MAG TPA: hypothetical protein VGG06_18230 [Thermoanaerobaculia bacterium]|jgi:PHD/YefM family antitoxin component YafN of YafNO toxin-antitoxin module